MIKSILKLLAIIVIGILIYNYFMGTPSEKENSKKIFNEMKDVGVAVKDLMKTEKQKFDSGKYDKAVDQIGDVLDKMKSNAQEFDEKYLDRIEELDLKKEELEREISAYQEEEKRTDANDGFTPKGSQDPEAIKQELRELARETEELVKEMERDQ